jgi:hypothetical protein
MFINYVLLVKQTRISASSEMDVYYCDVGIVKIIKLQFVCIEDVPLECSLMDGEDATNGGLI